MDKKAKKKLDVLRQRAQKLKQQIAGAKSQRDDEAELARLERELQDVEMEIEKLKAA